MTPKITQSPIASARKKTESRCRRESNVNDTTGATRLSQFRVTGLFGEFNHNIPLSKTERVTALIGPNGMGKTACLRLINALFHRHWSIFSATEFKEIEFTFTDGSSIVVQPLVSAENATDVSDTLGVSFLVTRPGLDVQEKWIPRSSEEQPSRLARIEGYLPFLTRITAKTWRVDSTRQILSFQEVIENFGERLPESVRKSFNAQPTPHLAKLIEQIDCHLIETKSHYCWRPCSVCVDFAIAG
jgi:hypothetical protein